MMALAMSMYIDFVPHFFDRICDSLHRNKAKYW